MPAEDKEGVETDTGRAKATLFVRNLDFSVTTKIRNFRFVSGYLCSSFVTSWKIISAKSVL